MPLPRPHLPTSWAALRRPTALAPLTTLVLAALLGGGLVVANATHTGPFAQVDGTDAADTSGGGTGGAATTSGGDDNVAVAVNTRDGSTVYALRLKVVITGADTVDSGNAAVAAASCSDCQTVAIALEGVIVTGDAEVVAPENIALAINSECSNCQTLAYAYQNLQTVDGRVRLTGEGRAGIARLRQQLNALRTSGLDILAVKAEVDRIAGEFAAILGSEVVPIGRPSSAQVAGASGAPSASATATATPAATSPGTSQETSAPSPSPTSSTTPSPQPTASG